MEIFCKTKGMDILIYNKAQKITVNSFILFTLPSIHYNIYDANHSNHLPCP